MTIQILMPALSPTMTEGNLAKWLKKEGDQVKAGDVIAEIETDKATMEVEAVDEGKIGRIIVPEGTQNVAVNSPIATLLEEGESADATASASTPAAQNAGSTPADAAKGKATVDAQPKQASEKQASAPNGAQQQPAPHANGENQDDRIKASPVAKRIASNDGIDLSRVTGSGPNGRIVKADVEGAKANGGAPQQASGKAAPPKAPAFNAPPAENRTVPHNNIRRIIARRLVEAKQQIPHFYLAIDVRIDKLLALRKQINGADESLKISVNDFVVRACALALRQVPAANASWGEDAITLYGQADVSVAVATDNGLITPIVRAACSKSLSQISAEVKELAGKARANKLKPEEFQGGSFSVSNLGMYGIKNFNAIINPPQACILAVGAGEERPIVENGEIKPATLMTCTLSVDHRAVDGAVGAEFLAAFKKLIEEPIRLLV